MKTIALIIGIIVGINLNPSPAQNTNSNTGGALGGIYYTAADYEKGNLTMSFNSSSGQIKLHHPFSSKYADVIVDGKKTRLNKDSIFGYRNCKNESYRFYKKHDEEYRIMETNGIVIYTSYVKASAYNVKTIQLEPAYFFSKTIDSEILPLTSLNLKREYPDNIKFHDMLDVEFGNGESLSTFSSSDKEYKVNVIFNKSNLK